MKHDELVYGMLFSSIYDCRNRVARNHFDLTEIYEKLLSNGILHFRYHNFRVYDTNILSDHNICRPLFLQVPFLSVILILISCRKIQLTFSNQNA